MKTIPSIIMILLLTASFTFSSYNTQSWGSWSDWQQSDCYEGIWTRHRSQPSTIQGKQRVQLQVQNRYRHDISINTKLTNDPEERPIYRLDISAGESYSSGATEEFLLTGHRFFFRINDVRFEGDKYGDPFRACDRKRY